VSGETEYTALASLHWSTDGGTRGHQHQQLHLLAARQHAPCRRGGTNTGCVSGDVALTKIQQEPSLPACRAIINAAGHARTGLYWGHRIQHESAFLWRFHRAHHRIATPTPVSVMCIAQLDATLQGGLPMALAAAAARPCPAALCAFFFYRVAENTLNHSGLDSRLLDALCLKALPFRAPAAFHDAHHRSGAPPLAVCSSSSGALWACPRTPAKPLAAGSCWQISALAAGCSSAVAGGATCSLAAGGALAPQAALA
jgi:hypothetical protein